MADRTSTLRADELPKYVVHADWSVDARKRWMAVATLGDDGYQVAAPVPVDAVEDLVRNFRRRAGSRSVVLGFDFPIGVSQEYAKKAGISNFPDALLQFGRGTWSSVYNIADILDEVSLHRPFYPGNSRPGHKQAQFAKALGLAWNDLFRRCDRATESRGAACCMFWTLGGNQVGRAASSGWRAVLVPALQDNRSEIGLWPFDGDLSSIVQERGCVFVETYPAEACVQLGLPAPGRWNKRDQSHRARHAARILEWVPKRPQIRLGSELEAALTNGFGSQPNGDDRFDAVVGLLALLDVVLGVRPDRAPDDDSTRRIEGWICGQDASVSPSLLAADHPTTRSLLRWTDQPIADYMTR